VKHIARVNHVDLTETNVESEMSIFIDGKTLEQMFEEVIEMIDDKKGRSEVIAIFRRIEKILSIMPEEERGPAMRVALFKAVTKLKFHGEL